MHYDLLEKPDGYETDKVLIVAPYFDPKFIKMLVKKLNPSQIRLVVDDGIRLEDLDEIRKACGKQADVKICLGGARGLVHMKIFYLEFVKLGGHHRRKRRLLFGSANATEAAFGKNINAELMAEVDLSAGQDGAVLAYIKQVIAAVENNQGEVGGDAFGPIQNSPVLYLPPFKIRAPGLSSGFDVWLQRGVLAAKYRDAQHFLMIGVTLKSPLPQDLIARLFANRELVEQGERNVVRFAYMNDISAESDDDVARQWKARYCVWTHLGDWVSDECYREQGYAMKSKAAPLRKAKIMELLENSEDNIWKEQRKAAFLNALDGVWSDLLYTEASPDDFLVGNEGCVNHQYYSDRFDKKLEKDILLAQDKDFSTRYIDGYAFPDVPRFRQDTAAWDSFALSWCESIIVESRKTSTFSLLAKRIGASLSMLEEDITFDDFAPKDMLKWLRRSWGKMVIENGEEKTVGNFVASYYN